MVLVIYFQLNFFEVHLFFKESKTSFASKTATFDGFSVYIFIKSFAVALLFKRPTIPQL